MRKGKEREWRKNEEEKKDWVRERGQKWRVRENEGREEKGKYV